MDINQVVEQIEQDVAQAELNHVEATQGPKYVMSDADINAWMDD